jgi:dUTPase
VILRFLPEYSPESKFPADAPTSYKIKAGDRIAQGRLVEMIPTIVKEIGEAQFDAVGSTGRGEDGFGSSGR